MGLCYGGLAQVLVGMVDFIPLLMFACVCRVLPAGYPVAFSLADTALLFAGVGSVTGAFARKLSISDRFPFPAQKL